MCSPLYAGELLCPNSAAQKMDEPFITGDITCTMPSTLPWIGYAGWKTMATRSEARQAVPSRWPLSWTGSRHSLNVTGRTHRCWNVSATS